MPTSHTLTGTQPAAVSVTAYGELRAERHIPGALRVLVAGQAAGGVERAGDMWRASWYAGMRASGAMRDRVTEHATADDAVRAVVRSAWARRLGARAASPIYWSDRARRVAGAPARRAGAR